MTDAPVTILEKHATYQSPTRECDVVMKGGVTSGIVYPRAICRLAEKFKLRSVGGTSAGAIAAALAAAAEVGRKHPEGGFARLAGVPHRLGELTRNRRPTLAELFQAGPSTRLVLDLFLALTRKSGRFRKALSVVWVGIRRGGLRALVPIVIALGLSAWILARGPHTWGEAVGAVVVTITGLVAGIVWASVAAFGRIPANQFGVCTGRTVDGAPVRGLTEWLHEEIQALAGRSDDPKPLHFGDLENGGVDLQVVTTCLTHGRPYALPGFRRTLYFCPTEFRKLFPESVVADLVATGQKQVQDDRGNKDRSLEHVCMHPRLPLDRGDHLPVIVATRMSLSFPILLSAVPLWDFDWGGDGIEKQSPASALRSEWEDWIPANPNLWTKLLDDPAHPPPGAPAFLKPERAWFSDGGISSNFPIQLFDAPVPTRPTVAIDLRYHPTGTELDDKKRVQLAQTNSDRIDEDWSRLSSDDSRLGTVFGFAARILGSMQNWSDMTLAKVPGFRDRFASVHLKAQEGGLNLEMKQPLVGSIAGFGEEAGTLLRERFEKTQGVKTELTWTSHRWTRLRTSLAVLEDWLEGFVEGVDAKEVPSMDELVVRDKDAPPTSYKLTAAQRDGFPAIIEGLREILRKVKHIDGGLVDPAPRPMPLLRVMPAMNKVYSPRSTGGPKRSADGYDANRCDKTKKADEPETDPDE